MDCCCIVVSDACEFISHPRVIETITHNGKVISAGTDGKVHREGYFCPFPYKLVGYPEVSRNVTEDPYRWNEGKPQPGLLKRRGINPLDRIEERVLGPSILCTVDGEQYMVANVS